MRVPVSASKGLRAKRAPVAASRSVRMCGAVFERAAMLWVVNPYVLPLAEGSLGERALGMLLLVGSGGLVYAGAGFLIGAWSPRQLVNSFRRG